MTAAKLRVQKAREERAEEEPDVEPEVELEEPKEEPAAVEFSPWQEAHYPVRTLRGGDIQG